MRRLVLIVALLLTAAPAGADEPEYRVIVRERRDAFTLAATHTGLDPWRLGDILAPSTTASSHGRLQPVRTKNRGFRHGPRRARR